MKDLYTEYTQLREEIQNLHSKLDMTIPLNYPEIDKSEKRDSLEFKINCMKNDLQGLKFMKTLAEERH